MYHVGTPIAIEQTNTEALTTLLDYPKPWWTANEPNGFSDRLIGAIPAI